MGSGPSKPEVEMTTTLTLDEISQIKDPKRRYEKARLYYIQLNTEVEAEVQRLEKSYEAGGGDFGDYRMAIAAVRRKEDPISEILNQAYEEIRESEKAGEEELIGEEAQSFADKVQTTFGQLDFENFNRTTSEILKLLLPLPYEAQMEIHGFIRGKLADIEGSHRWVNWIKTVKEVLDAGQESRDYPADATEVGVVFAYNYIQKKHYNGKSFTFTQISDVILATRDRDVERYGVTGRWAWFYDNENVPTPQIEDEVDKELKMLEETAMSKKAIAREEAIKKSDYDLILLYMRRGISEGEINESREEYEWKKQIRGFISKHGGEMEDYPMPSTY